MACNPPQIHLSKHFKIKEYKFYNYLLNFANMSFKKNEGLRPLLLHHRLQCNYMNREINEFIHMTQ